MKVFSVIAFLATILTASGAPPPNDMFALRTVLPPSGAAVFGTTAEATAEAGEPIAQGGYETETVWYSWTAATDCLVYLESLGTCPGVACPPFIAIFTGSDLANLSLVAKNDLGDNPYAMQHVLRFEARAGVEHQIRMANSVSPSFALYVTPNTFWVRTPAHESDLPLGEPVRLYAGLLPAEYSGQFTHLEFVTRFPGAETETVTVATGPDYSATIADPLPGSYMTAIRGVRPGGEFAYFPGALFTVSAREGSASISLPNGPALGGTPVSIIGTYGLRYALEITEDFLTWQMRASGWITQNPQIATDGGTFGPGAQQPDFSIPPRRFYRLRLNP